MTRHVGILGPYIIELNLLLVYPWEGAGGMYGRNHPCHALVRGFLRDPDSKYHGGGIPHPDPQR